MAGPLALAAALVVTGLVLLRLVDVLLLIFGAVLFAILLNAIAAPLRSRTPLGRIGSLVAAVIVTGLAIAAILWAFGSKLDSQLASLADMVPRAWDGFQARLSRSTLGALFLRELDALPGPSGGWLSLAPRVAANAASGLAATVIVIFAGLYLAFHPQTYAQGLVRLFPRDLRARALEILAAIHDALKRWLLAQLLSMALVGSTTALGLWLVGAPFPIGLGVLAGLGQFVPVIGPMAAAVPGLLVALAAGPQVLAMTAGVYLVAAQLEANVITPLVLRRMAALPMAVTLFAVLAMGVLLGPLGVLLATPLAVVAYVLVKMVYVEDVLGDRPETPIVAAKPSWRRRRGP